MELEIHIIPPSSIETKPMLVQPPNNTETKSMLLQPPSNIINTEQIDNTNIDNSRKTDNIDKIENNDL